MSYEYKTEKPRLFTEDGQVTFNTIRDYAFRLSTLAGCFRADKAMSKASGDTWTQLACLDRMIELGEIVELTDPTKEVGQYRVFRRVERTA